MRRFWRFGQMRPVHVHIALAETEAIIWNTIQRKARDHERMKSSMNAAMREAVREYGVKLDYRPTQPVELPIWLRGDAA